MISCISTYSFHQKLACGEITQLETLKLAKELGFEAVEICDLHNGDKPLLEYAKELRNEADRLGLVLANFVFGADLFSTRTKDGKIEDEIAYVKTMVDAAEVLGVKVLRHDALWSLGTARTFGEALPTLAKNIREISLYAKQKGIRTTVENHGRICQDPERMERLVEAVACDNFGALCDIGNFLCNDCDPVRSVSIVAPFTFYAHVKDFYFKNGNSLDDPGQGFFKTRSGNYLKGAPIGHGAVPVTQCLKILKDNGYNGYVTIEYEGSEDCISGIKIAKANLDRYISKI